MNGLGSFTSESLLEQGQSFVKKTANVATQGVKVTAQTAAAQVTGNFGLISDSGGTHIASVDHTQQPAVPSQQDTDEFVRELYGAEHNQQTQPNQTQPQPHAAPPQPSVSDIDQQQKLAETRQKLASLFHQQHTDSYFNPTFNNHSHQQEESVMEKNEREDQQKKFEDFEKKQKKPDFALQRAQTKTEGSPGASG